MSLIQSYKENRIKEVLVLKERMCVYSRLPILGDGEAEGVGTGW
jgi:hypothetical protein